jgi:hypothetical protein
VSRNGELVDLNFADDMQFVFANPNNRKTENSKTNRWIMTKDNVKKAKDESAGKGHQQRVINAGWHTMDDTKWMNFYTLAATSAVFYQLKGVWSSSKLSIRKAIFLF